MKSSDQGIADTRDTQTANRMWSGVPEEEGEQQKQSPNTELPRSSKTEEKQWPPHARVSANPKQNTNTRARAGTRMHSYTHSCTHIIIKVLKTKDEKKTIKAASDGGKWHYLQRNNHRFSRKRSAMRENQAVAIQSRGTKGDRPKPDRRRPGRWCTQQFAMYWEIWHVL